MHWEARFGVVASAHDGLVAKFHLPSIGCDSDHWWRARRSGRWLPFGDRVLRSAASPASVQQRVLACVLDASPGAVLHRRSALAWLGMRGFDLAFVEVARSRGTSGARPQLAHLHELRDIRPQDILVVRGVVTETALRAIWAEAALFAPKPRREIGIERIGNLLDAAHRLRLVTWSGLHESVDDLRQRGRAGTVIMRELAARRPIGASPTESNLETRFEKVLIAANRRVMRRQQVVGGHEPIGRCDFVDDDLPLIAEINSLTFHTTPTDRIADERRYQALLDAGFSICVVWEDDLWARQAGVVEAVDIARQHARTGHQVVIHSPGCPWPPPRVGAPAP
jgi:very-short-patch-repair endonuclease